MLPKKERNDSVGGAVGFGVGGLFADNEVHVICVSKYRLHNTDTCLYISLLYQLTVCALWSHSTMRRQGYKNVGK